MTLLATASEEDPLGYFRLFAKPPGGLRREITIFRNAPVVIESASTQDPFTHQRASISLAQVTVFDTPGQGDLDWLVPDSDIDIVWQNVGSYEFDWRWEGYIASYQFSISGASSTFQIDLRGALYGLDDYLAIPSFPKRPVPYEILIAQAFDQREHPAHLGQFRVLWPSWWEHRVPEVSDKDYLRFLKPWGVTTGQRWTGFTSRSTGSWEPALTGHVQGLLSVMFAEGGAQWSVRNRGYRRPELYLREIPKRDDLDIIEIQLGAPGVDFSGSRDYTQRASVIYGQGVDDAAVSYSGMVVSPDGKTTSYRPFAFTPQTWPRQQNPNYNRNMKAKEVMIRFQDGVDQISAQKIALGQLQRFNEPGITGSILLTSDVRYSDGYLCPRMLIQAGATIRIKGLFGISEGVLVHVISADADFNSLTMSLEFDTKYRDQLTVEEVKARTRDALTPLRSLQTGKYSNTVQDLVLPWSYTEGSGCVPLGAKDFFNEKLPSTAEFPYEEWTTQNPPTSQASKNYYIRINPTDLGNSTNNWSGVGRENATYRLAIPIRMAQAGTIRATQIAAYDGNGNVKPVRFHVSVYKNSGVGPNDLPRFPSNPETTGINFLEPQGLVVNYDVGQANPFFEDAWETVREDGTIINNPAYSTAPNAQPIVGWGHYYEPAGYSPGRFSRGAARTGMLVDEAQWNWAFDEKDLNLYQPNDNVNLEYAGMLFVQIFCDEQSTTPVYFMGRFIRSEPGTSS